MKKNYKTPKMKDINIELEVILIEGSSIDMGGTGDPDVKKRIIFNLADVEDSEED